jgi:hypothetical protein
MLFNLGHMGVMTLPAEIFFTVRRHIDLWRLSYLGFRPMALAAKQALGRNG